MRGRTPKPAPDAVVDGVNVDAIACAARTCSGVEQLHAGPPQYTATYLPDRRVEGVRIERGMVAVQLRARWGVRAPDLAAQIRRALVPMVGGRRIDILVADVGDPPTAQSPLSRVGEVDPVQEGDELEWTATNAAAAPTAASSSAATIPTAAGTQAPLSLG